MKAISTYSLSKLSGIFALTDHHKDYLLIDAAHYTPSTEEPFRTDTYAIAFLKKGQLGVSAGLSTGVINGPCILTLGPYIIRSIDKVEDNPEVDLVFFKESFFVENQSNVFYLLKYSFFENSDSHVINLSEAAAEKINIIFGLLKSAIIAEHKHEANVVRSYINILLCEIDAASSIASPAKETNKTSLLLAGFKTLLTKEVLRERSVRFYAGKLNVTPKHLSEVIKAQTGRTAGEWIDQSVILEAKVLLQQKDMSISQVADALNFSDQSVFGKFFKVNTGLSPLAYRNALD